jgi:hypothetical protein
VKKQIASALLVLALGTGASGFGSECYEDETCWDGRTMGNHITGERWVGHNGADTWGPDRINWYVLVKWYGDGRLDERST